MSHRSQAEEDARGPKLRCCGANFLENILACDAIEI